MLKTIKIFLLCTLILEFKSDIPSHSCSDSTPYLDYNSYTNNNPTCVDCATGLKEITHLICYNLATTCVGIIDYTAYIFNDSPNECADINDQTNCKFKITTEKKCYSSCPTTHPFYDKDTNECLVQCPGSNLYYDDPSTCGTNNYKCKSSCSTSTHPFIDGYICKMKCPNGRPYYSESGTDKNKCIAECTLGTFHNYGSYGCKTSCSSDYYIFNYICYPSCPSGTLSYTDENDSNKKKCKCFGNYKQEVIGKVGNDEIKIIVCLDVDAPCPAGKQYFIQPTNECLESKPDSGCDLIRKLKTSPINYQCLTECAFDEYKYTDSDTNTIYCVTECPVDFPYIDTDKCAKKCENFVDENTKTCYDSCPEITLYSSNSQILGQCYFGSKCPPTYPYSHYEKKACSDSCDTLKSKLGELSDLYLDEEINECFAQCPEGKFNYDDGSGKHLCVLSCKEYSQKSYNGVCCGDNCPDNSLVEVDETGECVLISDQDNYYHIVYIDGELVPSTHFYKNKCPETYGTSDVYQDYNSKKCYLVDCPDYKKESPKLCVTCEAPTNSESKNNGYKIYTNPDDKTCYESCPIQYPYYDNEYCYDYPLTDKKRIDGTYKYVETCPNGYYEFNSICYYGGCPENAEIDKNSCKCSYNSYESDDGDTICLGLNELCPSSFPYLNVNKKCIDTICDNDYLRKVSSNPDIFECLSGSCELNELYYELDGKKVCVSDCPDDKLYRDSETDTTNGLDIKLCRTACDATKTYTDEKYHLCYKSCPDYGLNIINTSTDNTENKGVCIPDNVCPNTFPYFYKDTKTCTDDCKKIKTKQISTADIYLDLVNNECVETCPTSTYKYIDDKGTPDITDDDVYYCVEQCKDNEYILNSECVSGCGVTKLLYLYENKKCLNDYSNCLVAGYYKDSDSTKDEICYETCPQEYYHDDTNKICYQTYSNDLYTNNIYIFDDTTKEVVSNCDSPYYFYNDSGNKKKYCYDKCPDFAPYFNYGTNECRDSCSDTTYSVLKESTNECIDPSSFATQCGGGIFNGICYEACPENTKYNSANGECDCVDKYYKRAIDSQNFLIECLKEGIACPSNKPYITNFECSSTACASPQKQRDVTINGITNHECLDSSVDCNNDEYKYSPGTSLPVHCVSKCPEAAPYHVQRTDETELDHRNCKTQSYCQGKNYFIDEKNFICYEKCPGLATVDETMSNNIKPNKCVLENDCPSSYPYLYGTLCLSDCSFTNKLISSIFGMPKATNLDTITKKCVERCDTTKQYYDVSANACVQNCRDDQYILEKNCYDDKNCGGGNLKLIFGTHKCVETCPEDYPYSLDNYCYQTCPNGTYEVTDEKSCVTDCSNAKNNKYINDLTNKCSTCNANEGYYVSGDSRCYSKCPNSAPYYLSDPSKSNKCYSKSCPVDASYSEYKYLNPKTNECMNSCSGFKFNNICYSDSCPDLTVDSTDNECKCAYNYYEKNSLKICLDAGDPCPITSPYISLDGKCSNSCGNNDFIRTISSLPVNYVCTSSCNDDEYQYTDTYGKKYCLKQCPEAAQYYYDDTKVCTAKCKNPYYTDEINHICFLTCLGLSTINESNGNKEKCILENNCPVIKPYRFKDKYCLSSCSSTDTSIIGATDGEITVLDKTTNQCVPSTSCKFKDESGNCVEKCEYSQFTDVKEKICYNKCTSPKYTVTELKQCITDCSSIGYYKSSDPTDLKCYKACPSGYKIDDINLICYKTDCLDFYKVSYNKCVASCDVPKNKNYLQIEEGYIYNKLCLDECPDDKPFIIKSNNECKSLSELTGSSPTYYRINESNEFVEAEEDVCPKGYYLFNNVCYLHCPENSEYDVNDKKCKCSFRYYLIKDPIISTTDTDYKVCLGPNEFCPNKNKIYIENDECGDKCTGNTYYLRQISSVPINYECVNLCNSDEFINVIKVNSNNVNECVKECPETAPYHIFGRNKCYSDCSSTTTGGSYYTDKVNRICYDECPGLGSIDESKKALTKAECLQDTKCSQDMYLYDVKNVCLKDCKKVELFKGSAYIKDEEKKKCISSCGTKYLTNNNECVDSCPEGSYIHLKTCLSSCPTDISGYSGKYLSKSKVCITDTEALTYYYCIDGSKECYESCPLKNSNNDDLYQDESDHSCKIRTKCNFYKISNRKCLSTCDIPNDPDSLGENEGFTIKGPKECLDKCNENYPYYIKGENLCRTATDADLKDKYKIENTNIYTTNCPDNYYSFNKVCYKDQCPRNSYSVQNSNKCKCSYKFTLSSSGIYNCFSEIVSCPSDSPYFDPEKGCVSKCGNKIKKVQTSITAFNYECVSSCTFGDFEYTIDAVAPAVNLTFCVNECPEDKKYHVFNTKPCIQKCDSSKYYTDNRNFTCRVDCDGLKTLDESTNNLKKGECISGSKCPNNLMLFAEKSICLSACLTTNYFTTEIVGINQKTTYLHEGSIRQCLQDCSAMLTKRYISSDNKNVCVEKCENTDFIYNYKCYTDCANAPVGNTYGYYIAETRECVKNCGYYFWFSGDPKKCFKECPDIDSKGNKLFIKNGNKECITCISGTYRYYIENDTNRICYISCPPYAKRHIKDDNKCITSCLNVYPYLYEIKDTNECVESCPSGYYRFNYDCYAACPSDFNTNNDLKKCNCKNKYYKSYDKYNNTILNCIDDCPADKPYSTGDNECVADCPLNYIFKDVEAKKCYSSCPQYTKVSLKKCISNCKVPAIKGKIADDEGYYISGSTTCYDECPNKAKFHNIGENKCFASCGDSGAKTNFVFETNECVDENNCPDGYYFFNGVCYKDKCPENTMVNVSLNCRCAYKFYLYSSNPSRYVCLSEYESCPQNKNYYDGTQECKKSCGRYLRKKSTDDKDYQCLNECPEDEFIYSYNGFNFCVKSCPIDKQYHEEKGKVCLARTSCNRFIDEKNKICYYTCPSLHTINDESTNTKVDNVKGECLQEKKCSEIELKIKIFYYEKTNTCISSCGLTSVVPYLGNVDTYAVSEPDPDNNSKTILKCISDCSKSLYKKLTDVANSECVKTCGENGGGKFLFNEKCYTSCAGTGVSHLYYLEDTKECVYSCPDGYYKSDVYICYKNCPILNNNNKELYLKITEKYCTTCETESVGYRVLDSQTKICYEKCPDFAPYHDKGSNICFSGGCFSKNNPNTAMAYSIFNYSPVEDYTCYLSCNIISGYSGTLMTDDYQCIKESTCPITYPYLYSNVCYKNGCPYDNMKTATTKDGLFECKSSCGNGEYYQDDKCVSLCESGYSYKIPATSSSPGYCFKDALKCSTTINQYFSETEKVCRATCDGYKIEINYSTGRSNVSSKGTCIPPSEGCPSGFPYFYDNTCYSKCPSIAPFVDAEDERTKYTCLKSCSSINKFEYNRNSCISTCLGTSNNYYIEYIDYSENPSITRKVCVSGCSKPTQYFFSFDRKCRSSCKDDKDKTYSFNPETNECVESCTYLEKYKYTDKDQPSACLSGCYLNYPYYYESDKRCMSKCNTGDYHLSSNLKVCVKECGKYEKRVPEAKQCAKTNCPTNYPYEVEKNESNDPSIVNFVNYCFSKCDGSMTAPGSLSDFKPYIYILDSSKKCTTGCEGGDKYHFSGVCYTKCPDIVPYNSLDSSLGLSAYQCNTVCPNGQFHNIDNDNGDEKSCVKECTGEKYKYFVNGFNICFKSCPAGFKYENPKNLLIECTTTCSKYLNDAKCLSKCDPYRQYYQKSTNQCLTKCPGYYKAYSGTDGAYSYECVSSCDGYFTNGNECVEECPNGKNFIGKNNICKVFCESSTDGAYYTQITDTGSYKIYVCSKGCTIGNSIYYVKRGFECLTACPTGFYQSYDYICYSLCKENTYYRFSLTTTDNKKKCVKSCASYGKIYDDDYKCIEISDCNGTKAIDENGKCVQKCNTNSNYKYKVEKVIKGVTHFICDIKCGSIKQYYYKKDYICISKCNSGDFIRGDGECDNSCDSSSNKTYAYPKGDVYECVYMCPPTINKSLKFFYSPDNICIDRCNTGDFINEGTNQCVANCVGKYPYKYFKSRDDSIDRDKCVNRCAGKLPYTWSDNSCTANCEDNKSLSLTPSSALPFYLDSDKICKLKCPDGFTKYRATETGLECFNVCAEGKFLYQEKCLDNCPDEAPYYFEKEKECLRTCGNGFYKYGLICVDICPSDKPYDNGLSECVEGCPAGKKYFVIDIEPENLDRQMHCLSDCPATHIYFVEITANKEAQYACYEVCPISGQLYYTKVLGKIARKCESKCIGDTPYVGDENECLWRCPKNKPYYLSEKDANITCYGRCPIGTYSKENEYGCGKCDNYIYEKDQTCLAKCKLYQYEYTAADKKIYCLDTCDGGLFITPDNKCVESCDPNMYLVKDPNSDKCICKKLYYYNVNNGTMMCIDESISDCRGNSEPYNIPVINSEECLRSCETIKTSDGYCLENNTCPSNSILTIKSDYSLYCKCRYKFYKNDYGKDVCLEKDEDCPVKFLYLVYETNECVETCKATETHFLSDFYCVQNCPPNYILNAANNFCECQNKWYFNEDNIRLCLAKTDCPESKPLLVKETKECVAKCPSAHPIIFNAECLSQCSDSDLYSKVPSSVVNTALKPFGNFTCQCLTLWFYELSGYVSCTHISRIGSGSCSDIDNNRFGYLVKDTGQCLYTCPEKYLSKFNFECFSDCDVNANSYYKDYLVKKSDTECKCRKSFTSKINTYGKTILNCIDYNECDLNNYLFIVGTNECLEGSICPADYPVLFNRKCYKTCPENSYYNFQTYNYCSCKYKWYIALNEISSIYEIICLGKDENCTEVRPYINVDTNECKENTNKFNYVFNNKGYENSCPITTKAESTTSPINCICDSIYGYWYIDDSDQNDYLVCGLEKCPEKKPYYKLDTKECVFSCRELTDYVVFKKACYHQTICPPNTRFLGSNLCGYEPLLDSIDFESFHAKLKNDILYYYEDTPKGGVTYSKFGVTTQLLGIDKNIEEYKNATIKSNLTYIDFGKCIDKIYKSNDLNDGDKIILLKFDSETIPDNYLIHPVEYEAYSSKTGKKIDLAVCAINDIVISYPVADLLNTGVTFRQLADAKNIKQLFTLGKKLNDDDKNIDSFNLKNILYNDLCQKCAIDGKDLIIRDRIPYLYPENASLCESNCTFILTDFERKRFNCLCKLKLEVIKDRKQKKFEFNTTKEEIEDIQKGPTNFPVLKCIDQFEISHNGGFFFMGIAIILEIVLCVLCFTIGYMNFIKKLNLALFGKKAEVENDENHKNYKTYKNKISLNENAIGVDTENKNLKSSERLTDEIKPSPPRRIHLKPIVKNNNNNGINNNAINNNVNSNISINNNNNLEINLNQSKKMNNMTQVITYRRNLKNESDEPRKILEKDFDENKEFHPFEKYFQDDIYSKYEKYSIEANKRRDIYDDEDLLTVLRKEKRNKDLQYETAIVKDKETTPIIILTFIVDKIYFTKTVLFRRKFDIFSALASLYILYHVLVLSLMTMFFDLKTISKIFFEESFPNLSFYLLYGLICNVIAWFIYRLLGCLIKNNNKVINFIARWKSTTNKENNDDNKTVNNDNNDNNNDNNTDNNNDNNSNNINDINSNSNNDNNSNSNNDNNSNSANKDTKSNSNSNNEAQLNVVKDGDKLEDDLLNTKFKRFKKRLIARLIVYYIIEWAILLFCFFYLCLFCSVYISTKNEVFKAYGIGLFEILIIKVVYAIILGCLRSLSIDIESKGLYSIIKILDLYLS